MGTELNEGTCCRLGASWSRHRQLIRVLIVVLVPLAALLAAGAAQALMLPAMPTAAGAASMTGDARSLASSVTNAATAAVRGAAPVMPAPAGAAPVQQQIGAAVQSVRATASGTVPATPTPGDSPPAHPAPTVVTAAAPVSPPPPVQQIVATALQKAGVTAERGESESVPVTAIPPAQVAGTAGPPPVTSQLLAAVGDLATRLGTDPATLMTATVVGRNPGAAAPAESAGRSVRTPTGGGRRRFSADPADGRRVDPVGGLMSFSPAWPMAALGSSALRGAPARPRSVQHRPGPRRAPPVDSDPATQAPPLLAPAQNAPAAAAGVGGGVGAAAGMLFIIAVIWLVQQVGDRMPLEAAAWRETLLALRLERPG